MSIKFKNVSYVYSPDSPFEKKGLDNVSFELKENSLLEGWKLCAGQSIAMT